MVELRSAKIQDMSNHIGVLVLSGGCVRLKQQTNTGWLEAPKKNHGLGGSGDSRYPLDPLDT